MASRLSGNSMNLGSIQMALVGQIVGTSTGLTPIDNFFSMLYSYTNMFVVLEVIPILRHKRKQALGRSSPWRHSDPVLEFPLNVPSVCYGASSKA